MREWTLILVVTSQPFAVFKLIAGKAPIALFHWPLALRAALETAVAALIPVFPTIAAIIIHGTGTAIAPSIPTAAATFAAATAATFAAAATATFAAAAATTTMSTATTAFTTATAVPAAASAMSTATARSI